MCFQNLANQKNLLIEKHDFKKPHIINQKLRNKRQQSARIFEKNTNKTGSSPKKIGFHKKFLHLRGVVCQNKKHKAETHDTSSNCFASSRWPCRIAIFFIAWYLSKQFALTFLFHFGLHNGR